MGGGGGGELCPLNLAVGSERGKKTLFVIVRVVAMIYTSFNNCKI